MKKRLQGLFLWIFQNIKNSFFIERFRWLLLKGEMGKLKKSKCKCPEAATVFKEKHLCWNFFFIKLFPVNIAKFLRAIILKNICERLLMIVIFNGYKEQRLLAKLDEWGKIIMLYYIILKQSYGGVPLKGVLKIFAKFRRKHLDWNLFFKHH